ncbi:hypothetical protein [Deinococcus reticulitermitis]|uniref:hypothetical protein n=1 Tax=Deinococcus reticulitermitis TaxID=856736 RepID=UPI0011603AF6|nr:hypothetical protein [Deinococcus reticulitermitis]
MLAFLRRNSFDVFSLSSEFTSQIVESLIQIAQDESKTGNIRISAIDYLIDLRKDVPVESYDRIYKSILSKDLKSHILYQVGHYYEKAAAKWIIDILDYEKDVDLQVRALQSLADSGEIEDLSKIPDLQGKPDYSIIFEISVHDAIERARHIIESRKE